ncbi:MAG: MaoC/PaaZ C-terminal domain-containing protein [Dehalococcoidia bacterium]|nr:MaoC/PaaZ C-terminal domain-containing protein [Dehalococcoidia bacterium]
MIANEPYFEEVTVGEEIQSLVKPPITTRQLMKYGAFSGDFYELHYDQAFARSTGLDGIIAHGLLKFGFLGQLVGDFVGTKGTIKKVGCSYRGMDLPGDVITCRGKVKNKYVKDGENIVELEIWAENQKGQIGTPGTATVSLPSRQ